MRIDCPPGERALFGGFRTNRDNLYLTDSFPSDQGGPGNSWNFRWEFENGDSNTVNVDVWTLCAPNQPG